MFAYVSSILFDMIMFAGKQNIFYNKLQYDCQTSAIDHLASEKAKTAIVNQYLLQKIQLYIL